jgi:hypothetical protein
MTIDNNQAHLYKIMPYQKKKKKKKNKPKNKKKKKLKKI